jgi:hypothetical protein
MCGHTHGDSCILIHSMMWLCFACWTKSASKLAARAPRKKSKLTYRHRVQNHYRSMTICLEAINKNVHYLLFLWGDAYIGLESLFPSVVETDALAFRTNVGHNNGYLGACVHVCFVQKPLQNTTAAGATILVTQNSQSNGVWVY